MKIQAIRANIAKKAQKVGAGLKAAKDNAKVVLAGKDKYISQRVDANSDNIFKTARSDSHFDKMIQKVEEKAIKDFGIYKKRFAKHAGIVAAGLAGAALLGVGIAKAVKAHNAKKAEAPETIDKEG